MYSILVILVLFILFATYKNGIHTYYEGYTSGSTEFIQQGGWIGCTNNWYNLFDKDYESVRGYNTPGLSAFVGLRYTPR